MKKVILLLVIGLSISISHSASARDPQSFDALELANQYRDQVIKFSNIDLILYNGKIIISPKATNRGMLRPNDIPNVPPPPPIPKIDKCVAIVEHWGSPGDDNLEGVIWAKNTFHGNGGKDQMGGGQCDDIFFTYDPSNPDANTEISTIVGGVGLDIVNTQHKYKANFTDFDPSKDVINITP